ncbi:MAG: WecB/TagA/CpsF family glycosyltransferase [Bacteroidetes bacterium]|nr:WecB/TagA/CpsF family glycosyltransferase [Bacteroidota bacterium]
MLEIFNNAISNDVKTTIAYANADTLNKVYEDPSLKEIYNSFDHIHPDGIGVYLASKYLFGANGLRERFTGSDFYHKLTEKSLKKKYTWFFFGHTENELVKIRSRYPGLIIKGIQEGYDFNNEEVIEKINNSDPDIIIIGLSSPIQEKWMYLNRDKIKFRVMLSVGDGIKVFSGDKKRGPEFMRKSGLEWLVRVAADPANNFKRYFLGIPKFIKRIII